jgi:hypothetical protein
LNYFTCPDKFIEIFCCFTVKGHCTTGIESSRILIDFYSMTEYCLQEQTFFDSLRKVNIFQKAKVSRCYIKALIPELNHYLTSLLINQAIFS